ncbi:hypothetical protein FAZ19_16275 [Sphingobacterium alkalisoli]|uniref:Uncharacterized protein n=1 Tax=Sphingobacterium alkalisoli TaxID=1874115 RepID=A0A4U0GXG6_9SPHI|nr:hypothetical protein [Sphingobacterium alkalisoli]TJY63823.1 hypothetical protein FAZ19_16275 [Sphingobacterium alkalisoli]GGH24648.1 hypothetical protein GCM10011418_32710 [Sphingobacterium alkalisoli]
MKIKHINIEARQFKANGKTYFIEADDISIARWSKYEELSLELQYGTSSFSEMHQNWALVTKLANELQFADIAVLAHNMQTSVLNAIDRTPVQLKLCALFINEENEDRSEITDEGISRKIDGWRKEGLAIGDFFQLALVFSRLIGESSSTLTPEYLEKISSQIKILQETPIPRSEE